MLFQCLARQFNKVGQCFSEKKWPQLIKTCQRDVTNNVTFPVQKAIRKKVRFFSDRWSGGNCVLAGAVFNSKEDKTLTKCLP